MPLLRYLGEGVEIVFLSVALAEGLHSFAREENYQLSTDTFCMLGQVGFFVFVLLFGF